MNELNNMTVAQLKTYAADNNISLGNLTRKQDIIDVIQAAAEPPTASQETPETPEGTVTPPDNNGAGISENNAPQETPEAEQDKPDESAAPDDEQAAAPAPITPTLDAFEIKRVLKVTKPLIRGDDVKAAQAALISAGFGCGANGVNGIYGADTAAAVRRFQCKNRIIVSGKIEKYTARALGATWSGT